MSRSRSIVILAIIAVMLLCTPVPDAGAQGKNQRILVVNSYHPGFKWSDDELAGIQSVLPDDVSLYVEYMDTKRILNDNYLEILHQTYHHKYDDIQFDCIISLDDNALQFLLKHHEDLFPGVPIVFGGVNRFDENTLEGNEEFTGVIEVLDHMGTIDIALQFHPGTKQIWVIADQTTTSQQNVATLNELVQTGQVAVPVVYLDQGEGLELSDLFEALQNTPPGTIVLLLGFFKDKYGDFVLYEDYLPALSEQSTAPIYVHTDYYMGYGVVGGKLLHGNYHGKTIGQKAMRILDGEPVSEIPIEQEPTYYTFDYQQLKRWDISRSALPPDSIIVNTPDTFYHRNKRLFWGMVVVGLAQSAIIAVLLVNVSRRRRAEQTLRQNEVVLKQRASQLGLINEVSGQITAVLDLNMVLKEAADLIQSNFGYQHVGLFILDQESNDLVMRARAGSYAELFPADHRRKMGEGMVGWVAQHKKRLLANDVSQEPRYHNPFPDEIIRSELSVPIQIGSEIAGVLDVQSRNPNAFNDNDILVLETLADQLAAALHNARLFEQIKQYAGDLKQRVAERTADLEAANKHLQALGQVKDEFVSNVSHELRTPITNLKIYHEIIAKKPDELSQHLETLNRETRRLEHIVEDLLYLSRLEQKRIPMKITPLDINRLIGQYVADRLKLAEEQGLTLAFIERRGVKPVLADEMAMGQVVGILLTNALNYTPPGGSIEVRTLARQDEERKQWAGFQVSDTGLGITEEEQSQLFERFFRGEAAQKSGKSGTGLGLAIACEIIERHQGRIEFESKGVPGEGTTFTVWLPVTNSSK